jgi:alkyl hydroperoxide reductase subunit AhpC
VKLLAVSEAIKIEGGIKEHIISDKRGHARPDGVIRAPEGRTVKQLFVIAHEVGHVVMKHYDSNKPRHVEEYEADKYALAALKRHGVKVPRKLAQHIRQCIASMVKRAGPKAAIDPAVKRFIGPAGLRWVAIRSQSRYLISEEQATYAAI